MWQVWKPFNSLLIFVSYIFVYFVQICGTVSNRYKSRLSQSVYSLPESQCPSKQWKHEASGRSFNLVLVRVVLSIYCLLPFRDKTFCDPWGSVLVAISNTIWHRNNRKWIKLKSNGIKTLGRCGLSVHIRFWVNTVKDYTFVNTVQTGWFTRKKVSYSTDCFLL